MCVVDCRIEVVWLRQLTVSKAKNDSETAFSVADDVSRGPDQEVYA